MTVTIEQLQSRLKAMESRFHHYEEIAAAQNGSLARHEVWRHHYSSFPYLLGAPDDRLRSRFKDVFVNQTELSPKAQITPLPIGEKHVPLQSDSLPLFSNNLSVILMLNDDLKCDRFSPRLCH